MRNSTKTNKQLLDEIGTLNKKIVELEKYKTERNQSDEALQKSEELLRLITENTSDNIAMTTFDLKATYIYVNPSVKSVLGYEPEDLLGKSFFDFVHPDDKMALLPVLKKYVGLKIKKLLSREKTPIKETIEFRFKNKSGDWRFMQSTVNVAGKQLLAVTRDITERKLAEQDTIKAKETAERYLDLAGSMIVSLNTAGQITMINQKGLDILDYNREELIGKNWFDVCLPNDIVPEIRKVFSQIMRGNLEPVEHYENDIVTKAGKVRTVSWYNTVIQNEAGEIVELLSSGEDITEIKQAQKDLLESEKRFDLAMNATEDGLYDWNLITNKIYYSPAWKRMLGYEDNELPNDFTIWEKLTNPDDVKKSWKMQNELITKKRNRFELEFKMKHKEGHWIDIYSRASAIFNKEGKAIRIVGTHVDISERKRAEKELRQNEEKFRALFEQAGSYCMILVPNTDDGIPKIIDANDAACSEHGYTREEFIGRPVADIDDEEGKRQVKERTALIMTGKPFYVENMHVRKDGSTFAVAVNAQRIDIGDGPPLIFTTEYDISDRKKVEREIRSSITFLDTVMNESPFAMWISDSKGTVIRTNKILRDKLNLADEQIIGHYNILNDSNIIEQGKMPAVKAVFEEQKPTRFDIPWFAAKAGDDSFKEANNTWIDCSIFPIVDEFGNLINAVCQWVDISERMQAEAELAQHREHLEELVKERTAELQSTNKELEAFAYSVSHDLRAPLRAINGFANILMTKYGRELDAEGNRIGSIIQDNSQKMSQLINDLLAFSRMGRKEMNSSTIDMKNMANAIYFEASSEEERTRVDFSLADLPPVAGDPNMMRLVWMNLISNALKFSAQRSKMVISVSYQNDEKNTIFCIKDNGAGFDMQYVDKLFNVFQRLHGEDEFKGTGVGLALVQRIIHRHGGRIWAEAEEEKGAAFYFALPKHPRKI